MEMDELLKNMETVAEINALPIIGPQKGDVLVNIIRQYQPLRILEVGTLIGYSSILMAENLSPDGEIITIEIDPLMAKLARENFAAAKLDERIELVLGDARQVIPLLEGEFDLLFLDAVKKDYLTYLQLAEPKLAPNAVVIADNVKMFAPQVSDYLEYTGKSGKYQSVICDFDFDAVEVSVRR